MAKSLRNWVENDLKDVINEPLDWISSNYFFRDPPRPLYSDSTFFFAPADGVILYQKQVKPDEAIIDIKGKNYSLRDAMRDDSFDKECMVIGIFMTMYDVHINRIPYAGTLYYKELDPLGSNNLPMLNVEKDLIEKLTVNNENADYLHRNQRVLNRIYTSDLGFWYYVLQVADYDVDCITPFHIGQGNSFSQNQRFSQIRYGSQCELIIPITENFKFELVQETGVHVEAGLDPLIRIVERETEKDVEEYLQAYREEYVETGKKQK